MNICQFFAQKCQLLSTSDKNIHSFEISSRKSGGDLYASQFLREFCINRFRRA